MTFAAVAIVFLITCVALGPRFKATERTAVALLVAAAMVLAQLGLLLS